MTAWLQDLPYSNRWWGCAHASYNSPLATRRSPSHSPAQSCILSSAHCILLPLYESTGGECQAAWFSKFSSRPCQSRRWARNCQSPWKSGGKAGEHTRACECWLHYSVWRRPSACLYSFSETAVGILSLPTSVPLRGSLSQPRSSSSNSSALIGLHPHLLSLTTSSTLSRKRYRCTRSSTALSQHTSLCIWIAYADSWALAATLSWSQALLFPFSLGWYLPVPLPAAVWKPGNDVAYQFNHNWVTVLRGWRHCRE